MMNSVKPKGEEWRLLWFCSDAKTCCIGIYLMSVWSEICYFKINLRRGTKNSKQIKMFMRFGGRQSGVDAMCQASTGLSEIYVQAISTRKLHFPALPHQSYCHVGYATNPPRKSFSLARKSSIKTNCRAQISHCNPACIKELHMA